MQQQVQERKATVSRFTIDVIYLKVMSKTFMTNRETEQYAKREEVWNQIEELARKKNPQCENLINQMEYLSLSQNNNDFTLNEDDFSNEKIDQYSKDVS